MKGVLIIVAAWDAHGGLQRRWRRLAKGLAEGHPVTVLTWGGPTVPAVRSEDGVRIVRIPSLARWDVEPGAVTQSANTLVSLATALCAALVMRRRWTVAVGAGLHPEGLVAGLAARALRRPFFAETWLVGELGNVERLRRSSLFRPSRVLLRRATCLLAITGEAARELHCSLGRDAPVLRTYPAVDTDEFAPAANDLGRSEAKRALGGDGRRVLAYVGRFELRHKRLDVLLDAWERIDEPNWVLVLVGDGPDRDRVARRAAATHAVVLPWTEDPAAVLRGADAFVLPTEWENPGYALLEGAAAALPGVASDIAVFRELHPDGVELVPNVVDAWEEALRRLVRAGDDERSAAGAAARRWAAATSSVDEVEQLRTILDV